MSISSFKAGKVVGITTNWSTDRHRLHSILFLCALVYAYRHDEPLFHDDIFIADDAGPKLRMLDKHLEAFGSGSFGNVFHQIGLTEDDAEYVDIINECIRSNEGRSTSELHDTVCGYAWRLHYSLGTFKQRISDSSISIQARLLLNRSRRIKLISHQFPFEIQPKDLELLDITNQVAKRYTPLEEENNRIGKMIAYICQKNITLYRKIEGSSMFYFDKINDLSLAVSRLLSYDQHEAQELFLREYLKGNL